MSARITYKAAGVDMSAGDEVVQLAQRLAPQTFSAQVIGGIGGFGGAFRFNASHYRNPVLVSGADGVGTKVKIAIALDKHDTVGIDLVAMNVDDVVCAGAEPLFFLDYIGCHQIVHPVMKQLLSGMVEGCRQAGCALLGGETAEMPDLYAKGEYDLAGFAVGVVDCKRMLDGQSAQPGDLLVGLASSGLHSNGYTLARKVLLEGRGAMRLSSRPSALSRTLGEELLEPTRIYSPFIIKAMTKFPIRGVAHITGGGLPGNVVRILGKRSKALIYEGTWPVPPIFYLIQEKGKIRAVEMTKAFNMGIGMVLAMPGREVSHFLEWADQQGEAAYLIGQIEKGKQGVEII